jgi:S-formylglutathione hydrolase FrmB
LRRITPRAVVPPFHRRRGARLRFTRSHRHRRRSRLPRTGACLRHAWRAGVLLAAPVLATTGGSALEPSAPLDLRFEVIVWSDSLLPPAFATSDSAAYRTFRPDTLPEDARPRLAAAHRAEPPVIDGALEDWGLVRWNDLAGAPALFRGTWGGRGDYALRFALQWSSAGIVLGARLQDDRPAPSIAPFHALEAVTLALASANPVVQRYWQAGSRRFRLRADGRIEGWTLLRNRRLEPFDAASLGARAGVRDDGKGALGFELLVPWAALYPAAPGAPVGWRANVLLDDPDDGEEKEAAWSIVPGPQPRPQWAALDMAPPPHQPAWSVTRGSQHAETVAEWCVVPGPGAPRRGSVELRVERAPWEMPSSARALHLPISGRRPCFVRLAGLPRGAHRAAERRRVEVAMRLSGEAASRHEVLLVPAPAAILRATEAESLLASRPESRFPTVADVLARLQGTSALAADLGDWRRRRYAPSGILAHRAAVWLRVEEQLAEAELLRAARAAPAALLDRRWPRRGAGGVPVGEPLLRGFRSILDGSVQPYGIYVPERAHAGAPLLVVLHDHDQDARTLLDATSLVTQASARGWVVLCPYGRGNSGYEAAGERDVLEAIDAVRASLEVDGRRIYLTGLGMGGTGAWLLALRHPDLFAAATIVSGFGDLDQNDFFGMLGYQEAEHAWFDAHNPVRLLRAGMTTAFRIAHGEKDGTVSPVHARIMHARLAELGVQHDFHIDSAGGHGQRFFDGDLPANLDFLAAHARAAGGVPDAASGARAGPPVVDVFARGPFAIVWGSGGGAPSLPEEVAAREWVPGEGLVTAARRTAEDLAKRWRLRFAGRAPVLPDTAVTAEMLASTNLVLVGDPGSNRLLERWAPGLPVRYEPDACVLAGAAYPLAKFGIVFAAVNPEYPQRTLVVLSGMDDLLHHVPRSPFEVAAAYAIVARGDGRVEIGNFAP